MTSISDIAAHSETMNYRQRSPGDEPLELDASPSALFPSAAEQERVEALLTEELIRASERVVKGSVVPTHDFEEFRRELARFDFRTPEPLDALLSWTIAQMESGLVHVTHPRYFGLFNPLPTFPAQCGDRIAAAFNPQLATSTTSPVAVEIERHVTGSIARRIGFHCDAVGHFTSGGSEANYTAVICALTRATPKFAVHGARAFDGPPVLYVSRESHLAWLKIAHQAGIGRSAVRLIATDGCGRMDAAELRATIRRDLAAGCVPVMIAATAGTTNAGMIDPLEDCAEIAQAHNLWYHVDAAWGGALIASERLRVALAGIETADSVTIDAHKWFAATMGCGMFITRQPEALSSAFQVTTSFMPSNVPSLDPYVTTAQWSRRFLGLRLFLSLAAAGWEGYRVHVERAVELAETLKARLVAENWTIVNSSPLAVVCVTPPPGGDEIKSIARRVVASGAAWVAATVFEGSEVIRACITNGKSTVTDVVELVRTLSSAMRKTR